MSDKILKTTMHFTHEYLCNIKEHTSIVIIVHVKESVETSKAKVVELWVKLSPAMCESYFVAELDIVDLNAIDDMVSGLIEKGYIDDAIRKIIG